MVLQFFRGFVETLQIVIFVQVNTNKIKQSTKHRERINIHRHKRRHWSKLTAAVFKCVNLWWHYIPDEHWRYRWEMHSTLAPCHSSLTLLTSSALSCTSNDLCPVLFFYSLLSLFFSASSTTYLQWTQMRTAQLVSQSESRAHTWFSITQSLLYNKFTICD